jgi:hypothetical protein
MEIDYYLLGLRVLELQVVLLGGEIVVRIGNKKEVELGIYLKKNQEHQLLEEVPIIIWEIRTHDIDNFYNI